MKNIFLWLLTGAISLSASAQSDSAMYAAVFAQVKKQYAPDSRSILFKTEISRDTLFLESSSQEVINAFLTQSKDIKRLIVKPNLLPDSKLKGKIFGVTNLSVANNRKTPSHSSELVTQMLLGTPVQVLKKENGYYIVRSPDGYLSYVDPTGIQLMDEAAFGAWKSAEKIVYSADFGYAYNSAAAGSARVSDLVKGNILQVLKEENGYYKVTFPDHRIGFIPKAEAQPYKQWLSRPVPTADQILNTAKTLIGVPYLWGGTSIKGVDCSGFTRTSYFLNGVVIPRDASQQALVGTEVDITEGDDISLEKCLKNLRPGDLLFFSSAKRKGIKGGRVTHTAIYMDNLEYIQSSGMVMISSLDPKAVNYDAGHGVGLVSARRMLTEVGKPQITKVESHPWYSSK